MSTIQEEKNPRITFSNIKPFVIRGLLLLAGWKLLYVFILQPKGIPDNWLTTFTEDCTARFLSLFYKTVAQDNHTIYLDGIQTVIIAPQCNGLEVFVLYVGFLLCIPTTITRMLSFAIGGVLVIFALNILRTSGLAVMLYHGSFLFDFAHHYAFKLIIYAVAFAGWVLYTKKPAEK
ncbi:MAG: archaeosortase/exosortase family protein [Bacteroidetes bacterium]|nr:archaeosortase/exosortase family protein [Bacteroidota bacterium]